jgi:nicotinate-nucleotide adenylyltransferase
VTLRVCYGGTFDPVHAGHLAVATAARAALSPPFVDFIPAADPPHRPPPGASAEHRAAMLELAIAGTPGFRVDRRELRRAEPSWTVTTLRELRRELGSAQPVVWLLGADAFRGLPDWHEWNDLFALAHFVVAVRPGHDLAALPAALEQACAGRWIVDPAGLATAPAGRVWRLELPPHPASATAVRAGVATGAGHAWLPPAVADYIARHGLYRGHHGIPGV